MGRSEKKIKAGRSRIERQGESVSVQGPSRKNFEMSQDQSGASKPV